MAESKVKTPVGYAHYAAPLLRALAALLGGYLASFALTFCLARALRLAGLGRVDAAAIPAMLSFIPWLLFGLYACACRSVARAWLLPLAFAITTMLIARLLPGAAT